MTDNLPAVPVNGLVDHYRGYLLDDQPVGPQTVLVPEPRARALIADLTRALEPMGPDGGKEAAKLLAGSYPAREVNDANVYVRALTSVFAEVPPDIAWKAVDHITRHLKFLPTRADVHEVVSKLLAERRRMLSMARRHLAEAERRKQQVEPASGFEALTAEQRAEHEERMKALVAKLRMANA